MFNLTYETGKTFVSNTLGTVSNAVFNFSPPSSEGEAERGGPNNSKGFSNAQS